jgi:peptidyl-prolyl cis-trans isomerase C
VVYSLNMRKFLPVLLALAVSGCASSAKSDNTKVLARFDGAKITEGDLTRKIQALPKSIQAAVAGRKKQLIEDMAAEHFLLKEAMQRGLDKDPDVRDVIATAEKKILIAKLVEKEIDEKISVTDEELGKYYEFNKEEFMTPLLLRASHILVKTEAEAVALKAQLDAGADFEETARAHSTDATAIRGGDLGFFQRGQFVPEFEEAVFSMSKGETRGPVKSSFGYHIIRLNDRMEPRLRELRAVRNLVEERLVNEKRSRAFKEFVEKLKGNTKIEIDEAALGAGVPA